MLGKIDDFELNLKSHQQNDFFFTQLESLYYYYLVKQHRYEKLSITETLDMIIMQIESDNILI